MKVKRRSTDKIKALLKLAYLNHPHSMKSLKNSLDISQSNLESFADSLSKFAPKKIFNFQPSLQPMESMNARELNEYIRQEQSVVLERKPEVWLTKQKFKRKSFKQELKANRVEIKLEKQLVNKEDLKAGGGRINHKHFQKLKTAIPCSEYQFVIPSRGKSVMVKQRLNPSHFKKQNNTFQSKRTYSDKFPLQNNSKSISNTQRFWRTSTERVPSFNEKRCKTEWSERSGERTLSTLTQYDSYRNRRAYNNLVLQLQLNLQVDKRKEVISLSK